jgi:hypothetical protein
MRQIETGGKRISGTEDSLSKNPKAGKCFLTRAEDRIATCVYVCLCCIVVWCVVCRDYVHMPFLGEDNFPLPSSSTTISLKY